MSALRRDSSHPDLRQPPRLPAAPRYTLRRPSHSRSDASSLWQIVVLVTSCLTLAGCSPKTQTPAAVTPPPPAGPLRVLVVDDEGLAEGLKREWRARSESPFKVSQQPSTALFTNVDNEIKLDTDVIVFPPRFLGQLAHERLIRQLPANVFSSPEFQQLDLYQGVHLDEVLWDERPHAVPLGSPPLLLLTRRDWVATPPQSWEELGKAIERLQTELPQGVTPLSQPTAAGWGANSLIARAATYWYDDSFVSTLFDYRTLEPRIATPPFVRALEELVRDAGGGPEHTPGSALQALLEGRTAMAICWPSAVRGERGAEPVPFPVEVVDLPGAGYRYDAGKREWAARESPQHVTVLGFSGRLAALSRAASNVGQATTLLGWAAGPEGSLLISPGSEATTLFRKSHAAAARAFVHPQLSEETAAQTANVMSTALNRPELIHTLRIPHQHRYVAALDKAVQQALQGELAPAAALQQAHTVWEAITEDVGRDAMKQAYRRSLGVPAP